MRRFSQRNSLVTLSDINITPLLDLAFVLLIIFIITTPLLEKGSPLQLPGDGGKADQNPKKEDIRTLDVLPQGIYRLEGRPMKPELITQHLTADFRSNPNLTVYVRADKNGKIDYLARALSSIEGAGISRISFRWDATNP